MTYWEPYRKGSYVTTIFFGGKEVRVLAKPDSNGYRVRYYYQGNYETFLAPSLRFADRYLKGVKNKIERDLK